MEAVMEKFSQWQEIIQSFLMFYIVIALYFSDRRLRRRMEELEKRVAELKKRD